MTELTALRTENGKLFDAGKDAKTGRPSYTLEARTGPAHYKDAYRDTDPWLDLDESYFEEGREGLVYPKLPNIVTVFRDRCGYQIQSRSNPDHVARVELVSIDGLPVTTWQDSKALKTSVRVHPYRTGIWKDFSGASKAKSTTMRWKVTELGNSAKDSHPFAFRETPEAFNTADPDSLIDRESAKVAIETARTRIDDSSWYWDELIPSSAKLVDTDWQVAAGGDDGFWGTTKTGSFNADLTYGLVGCYGVEYSVRQYHCFARFTNITIPYGSTITACSASLLANITRNNSVDIRQRFVKATNPSAPTSLSDCQAFSYTTAYHDQTWGGWYSGFWYSDTALASVLQEIIDQTGWSSGNAVLSTLVSIETSEGTYHSFKTYEAASSSAPKLSVTWTEPPQRRPHIYVPNVSWLSKSLLKRREI